MKSREDIEPIAYEEKDVEVEAQVAEEPEPERVEAEVVTKGTVIANMLNIRSGPSTSFTPNGTLYSGNVIEYTVEKSEWLKLTDGRGYVMREFIQ